MEIPIKFIILTWKFRITILVSPRFAHIEFYSVPYSRYYFIFSHYKYNYRYTVNNFQLALCANCNRMPSVMIRPFLIEILDNTPVFGVEWVNRTEGKFRIIWLDKRKSGWTKEHGSIFMV